MSIDFSFVTELHDKSLVLKTEGYINITAGEQIVDEFSKHFNNGINKLFMDLEKTRVVNSMGVSCLIEIVEKLIQVDGKLIFTNLDPSIEKTFDLMGLFSFAEKADSVDSALR